MATTPTRMGDPPLLLPPSGHHHLATARGHYRSASQSPTRQRHTDDILARLTPRTAIDAFRSPTGPLKACMDAATASEQSFALTAAAASRSIQEWLDELSGWPWPHGGGSAGFEPPAPKRRRLSHPDGTAAHQPRETAYLGSLPSAEVVRYEKRIEDVVRDMDDLDLEEIKRQVLHNHILPLSRPGTPMSGSTRPGIVASTFNRMDDFTAVITATVLQALPNLSRLNRLMNAWTVRLVVLRRVPSMLESLADAEVAIQSGWNAIDLGARDPMSSSGGDTDPASTLSRKDFGVMKLILEKKVSKAARDMDFMLDSLEGREDTLPDGWVDRMDRVERDYSEWAAACERTIREAEWARMARQKRPTPKADNDKGKQHRAVESCMTATSPKAQADAVLSAGSATGEVGAVHEDGVTPGLGPTRKVAADGHIQPPQVDFDTSSDFAPGAAPGSDESEPELPDLSTMQRRGSLGSESSTIVHDLASERRPEPMGTPDLPRSQETEAFPSDGSSPPSSPPDFRASTQSAVSVSFSDMPTVTEASESPPRTPLDSSFMDESDMSRDTGTPSRLSVGSADLQLQQQISEILETIPAKFKLTTSEAPPINLNPPDLQLPRMKPRSQDTTARSHSSLSSRAGTPSFLLAPARNTRSRNQRGNQEIKLYHLSRSTGEAPIKLFIRCVGETGERVMVRVGGGWADLGEYLKEYASHHSRRSGAGGQVELRSLPQLDAGRSGSSPPSRPASALDNPMTPLSVRKTRKSVGEEEARLPRLPKTPFPAAGQAAADTPPSDFSTRSRSSSRLSWTEEDSSLGMSGPRAKNIEMSEESRAWVESVKERVRMASGERKPPDHLPERRFGEIDRVGATKRVFKRGL